MVLLITYDLNKETTRPPIVKTIKEICYSWAKLSESSYVINTTLSVDQVFSKLKPLIDQNDNIYIITLKKPWSGYGPQDVNQWLEKNLTY